MFPFLPVELQRTIFSFDPTYLEMFRKDVIPELMEMAWKRITYKFFTSTIDLDVLVEELYELVSDLEEEENEEEEVLFLLSVS